MKSSAVRAGLRGRERKARLHALEDAPEDDVQAVLAEFKKMFRQELDA